LRYSHDFGKKLFSTKEAVSFVCPADTVADRVGRRITLPSIRQELLNTCRRPAKVHPPFLDSSSIRIFLSLNTLPFFYPWITAASYQHHYDFKILLHYLAVFQNFLISQTATLKLRRQAAEPGNLPLANNILSETHYHLVTQRKTIKSGHRIKIPDNFLAGNY